MQRVCTFASIMLANSNKPEFCDGRAIISNAQSIMSVLSHKARHSQ